MVRRYSKYFLPAGILALLVAGGMAVCRVDLVLLLKGIPKGAELIGHMIPPAWEKIPDLLPLHWKPFR